MSAILFRQLWDAESSTFTYLLADAASQCAVLIDPVKDQLPQYLMLLEQLELKLVYAFDTHTHADHITALGALRDETSCKTVMSEHSKAVCVSQFVAHNEEFRVGELTIKCLHTPGHTDDSCSFWANYTEHGALFTGDTLLMRGSGRTDFQNGSASEQYHSLFEILLEYPGDTWVYPAHDYKGWTVSTIAEEKAHNPRLQVASVAEYVALMSNLNLPNPKLMDVAVPANLVCGKV